jgi:hypothetical protein
MTKYEHDEVAALLERGHSPLSAARCMTSVSYSEIESTFGSVPYPEDRVSPAFKDWLMQQPWIWRPDNQNPIAAPWERLVE